MSLVHLMITLRTGEFYKLAKEWQIELLSNKHKGSSKSQLGEIRTMVCVQLIPSLYDANPKKKYL